MLLDQRLDWLWGAPDSQGHRASRVPGRAQSRDDNGAVASLLASQRPTLSVSQPTMESRAALSDKTSFCNGATDHCLRGERLAYGTLIRGTASHMY